MRTFKLIKDFINGSNIETDAFFRLFFLNYRADRAHPFDGSQVKFHGKYIENKKENIPYDPKIGLISYIICPAWTSWKIKNILIPIKIMWH